MNGIGPWFVVRIDADDVAHEASTSSRCVEDNEDGRPQGRPSCVCDEADA